MPKSPFSREPVDHPPFLIEQLLPACELSLMAGPSGSGKSRWLFDNILRWQQSEPVLGKSSHPTSWLYVSSDRSEASVKRTFEDMGIDPSRIPVLPAWDLELSFNGILDEIQRRRPGLAVVESFGSFVEPPANSNGVKHHIQRTARFMRQTGTTIWGVVESPKLKPFEKYENPRQRVSGAAAWGHFSETIFLLEPSNPKLPQDPGRTLFVCPRNGPGMAIDMMFDSQGHLNKSKLNTYSSYK
jgi:RecA-family ATPase